MQQQGGHPQSPQRPLHPPAHSARVSPQMHQQLPAHPRHVTYAHPPQQQAPQHPHQYNPSAAASLHQYNYSHIPTQPPQVVPSSIYVGQNPVPLTTSSPAVSVPAVRPKMGGDTVGAHYAVYPPPGGIKSTPPPPGPPQTHAGLDQYPLPYDPSMSVKQHQAAISRREQALAASLSTACQMVAQRGHQLGPAPTWEPAEPAGKDKLSVQVLPPGGGILPPVSFTDGGNANGKKGTICKRNRGCSCR